MGQACARRGTGQQRGVKARGARAWQTLGAQEVGPESSAGVLTGVHILKVGIEIVAEGPTLGEARGTVRGLRQRRPRGEHQKELGKPHGGHCVQRMPALSCGTMAASSMAAKGVGKWDSNVSV